MSENRKRILHFIMKMTAGIILIMLAAVLNPTYAYAGTDFNVKVSGTMGQTEARQMLDWINEFRHGSDAWYWNSDDTTKTVCTNLPDLKYDYNLEKIAMQRAIETALHFDHTRPNNSRCFTLTYAGTQSYGENIAAGQRSANAAYMAWREDYDNYKGQGHRRNMLNKNYTAIGIGHFYYNGYHYWVQEFGYSYSGASATAALDGDGSSIVTVNTDIFSQTTVLISGNSSSKTVNVELESENELPVATVALVPSDCTWPKAPRPIGGYSVSWSTTDSSIVSISGNKYIANKLGTTTLICKSQLGGDATLTVNVVGKSISDATVAISSEVYEYTGNEIKPDIASVTLNGKALKKDTDYKVSYSNNTNQGTGYITITGVNGYSGTITKTFTIKCSHDKKKYEISGSYSHSTSCAKCGRYIGYESHVFGDEKVVDKSLYNEPYYTIIYEKTCKLCGYISRRSSIEKDSTPTPTKTPSSQSDNVAVRSFVSRLYSIVLGREADDAGLNDWSKKLVDKEKTGSEVALGFFMSQEMINRNLSDEDYVKICYRTMLNREADEGGLANWVAKLENGISREAVLYGFSNSTEFDNICSQYGIIRGTLSSKQNRDQNEGITAFAARCYTKALGRKFDVDGLNDWTGQILSADNKKQKAEKVASDGFFHSQEFANKNTSNGEYVEILYRTFLGREYDEAGYNDWVGKLNAGVSRDEVLYGFSRSQEFSNIMASYGL